jgi:hypothetical protein
MSHLFWCLGLSNLSQGSVTFLNRRRLVLHRRDTKLRGLATLPVVVVATVQG